MSDPIFQRSLQDLIKDIKNELRSTDPFLKAEAVRKLTYLQMLGYNVSWASFAIVEVMSQPRFAHKRIGYLAANQSFNDTTDVILLTTNLFKKEFSCQTNNQYEIGLAINSIANIANKDLARDCMGDLVQLMNNTRPYVRKKAVLAMYKCYIKYPQGLRLTFDKLKDRLDDNENSVVSTAVNVICELANKNPRNYLAMAPKFFKLLTTTANNWMLIKVVKLLSSLVSEEPRLARKLLEPLATIIQNTGAKSLQYECINTVTEALPYTKRDDGTDAKNVPQIIKICSDNLRNLIEDPDQNLKYLGLCGLVKLMESSPRSVVEHRELVLKCLNDDDVTIRSRALELLAGIVSRKSLVDLVHHLLDHVKHSEGNYRDEIINKILYMCSKEKFSLVTDFAWYTSILLDLAVMQGSKHGKEVADQLIEIALRVDTVRPYAVESMLSMLLSDDLILGQARGTVSEVLKAASWIIGEYCSIVTEIANDIYADDDDNGYWIEGPTGDDIRSVWRGRNIHVSIIDALLHPRATNLPPHVQIAYIHAAMKVFIRAVSDCKEVDIAAVVGIVRARLGISLQSLHIEVQERASNFRHLLAEFDILSMSWQSNAEEVQQDDTAHKSPFFEDLLDMPIYTTNSVKAVDDFGATASVKNKRLLATITREPFYAVHSKAQRRVPVPEGCELHTAFNKQAIDKLLQVELPENPSLVNLTLTVQQTTVAERVADAEDARMSRAFQSNFENPDDHQFSMPYSSKSGSSSFDPNQSRSSQQQQQQQQQQDPNDKLFYLSKGKASSEAINGPLAKILAETFEDDKDKTGKKGKKGKKKSSSSKTAMEIDTSEMLPAGALSSDDERKHKERGSRRKNKNSGGIDRHDKQLSGDGLEAVDLSMPLRDDEVLAVFKHREVKDAPQHQQSQYSSNHTENEGSKSVTSKKEKKSSKSKSKSSAPAAADTDLLGLDWGSVDAPVSSNNMSSVSYSEPIAATATTTTTTTTTTSNTATNSSGSKSKSKSKTSGQAWQLLHSHRDVDICYTTSLAVKSVIVTVRVINNSTDDANVKMSVGGNNQLRPASTSSSIIASNLPPDRDNQSDFELIVGAGIFIGNTTVSGMIHYSEGSAPPVSFQCTIKIPVTVNLIPYKVSGDEFATLIGKSSTRWGGSSTRVLLNDTKPKTALKAIANFLKAHIVEAEGKAVSLCAKTQIGGYVFALMKVPKDGLSILTDIKCLCDDKSESQRLSDAIVQALNDFSF